MSVLTDMDRAIVAAAIARARRPVRAAGAGAADRAPVTKPLQFRGLCVFCGTPTLHPVACAAHADLPELDGRTSAVVTTNTNGGGRPTIPGSAPTPTKEPS